MSKPITAEAVRPSVSDITFSKIPFVPSVRSLKPGTIKVLAAVTRSSWVDQDTRRRITTATNRRLAELAETDPKTIGRHLRALVEAGVLTEDQHEGRRRLTLPEIQPGEFVRLDNTDQAWTYNPFPFVLLLAVRMHDWSNRGYALPTDATLARSLGWPVRAVKRAMKELRQAGAVHTSSRYDSIRRSRKRVITIGTKVVLLCDTEHRDKSGPHVGTKVDPTMGQKWSLPPDKSGPLNQSFERKFLTRAAAKTTNQESITDQSERAETAELAKVVVDESTFSDTTNPEPQPQPAGAPTPDIMAEVIARLAKSRLERDEQERYLKAARSLAESENPPPIAWHHHALDVQPSSGTKSLAGVVIARLKTWTTTPPEERAAIVEQVTMRDSEVIAKRLKSAKVWYEGFLGDLKAGRTVTPAKVREKWERYNAALKAAGQPPVVLPNEVLHAEQQERARQAVPLLTAADLMAEHAKREQATALEPPERTPAAVEPPPVDPVELERRRREKAEQREQKRIEAERNQLKAERANEIETRTKAFEKRELLRIPANCPGNMDDALTEFRTVTLPAKKAEIEAEVRAEFAPKFAALAPTRKPPTPPPGPPATIPAMVSR